MRNISIPLIPQFCYIKVGFFWVYITWACFPDEYQKFSTENFKCYNKKRCILHGHVFVMGQTHTPESKRNLH